MEFTAKILTESDRSDIIKLIESHSKVSRATKSKDFNRNFDSQLEDFLNPANPHFQMVGSVDSRGVLCAILGQIFWEKEPVWFASIYAVLSSQTSAFNPLKNGTICVMRQALLEGEKRRKFRFFILRNQRWPFKKYFGLLHKSLPEYARYARFVELTIPKNTEPQSWWAWKLMGEHLWDEDLYVEHLILKQEFRPEEMQVGVDFNKENYNAP